MRRLPLASILSWLVAAFFLVGSVANGFAGEESIANYARWGYPARFHYVTAALELATAGLIAYRPTRLFGAALGSFVMLAATGTLLRHGEYAHALVPLVVLAFTLVVALLATRRARSGGPATAGPR